MAADTKASNETRSEELGALVEGSQPDGCTLREVRKLVRMTRGQVAKAVGTTRYRVAKIEHAEDVGLTALDAHINALGGKLEIEVEFPGRSAVVLRVSGRTLVASPRIRD